MMPAYLASPTTSAVKGVGPSFPTPAPEHEHHCTPKSCEACCQCRRSGKARGSANGLWAPPCLWDRDVSRKPRSSTFWAATLEQSVFFEPRWPSRGPHCTLNPFLFWTGAEPTRDPVDCDHSSRPGRSPSRLMTPIPADCTKTLEVSRHLRADDFVHL